MCRPVPVLTCLATAGFILAAASAAAQAAKLCMAGTADATCPAIANPVTVVGTVSATILTLSNSPSTVCGSGTYGTIKVVNGRQFTCRP